MDVWLPFKVASAGALLWLCYVPLATLLHALGQVIAAKLLCARVNIVQLGQGDVFARRTLLGMQLEFGYNIFSRGKVNALVLNEAWYRTRSVIILLAGTAAMALGGLVVSYAMWLAMMRGIIPNWDFLPDTFLLIAWADCVINLIPIADLPRAYRAMDGHQLWELLRMRKEDVKEHVHCTRGSWCLLRNKKRMAAYHYIRASRFIAERMDIAFAIQAADIIFKGGKARPACNILVRTAERPEVTAYIRSIILDVAASYALYETPKPTMIKEAVEWVSQALVFDPTNPSIRGTKGAICLEMGWMQDAKANLQACLAWEEAPEFHRIISSVCYARVLAWMGDLPAARELLANTPTPREGNAIGMVIRVRREAYEEIARTEARWLRERSTPPPKPASQPDNSGRRKGKKRK